MTSMFGGVRLNDLKNYGGLQYDESALRLQLK